MTEFKLKVVEWETDNREVLLDNAVLAEVSLSFKGSLSRSSRSVSRSPGSAPGSPRGSASRSRSSSSTSGSGSSDESASASPPKSGASDRPTTPEPLDEPPPPRTYLQGMTWGYDVVTALDHDDPTALLAGLKRDGADPNARVDRDGYGGYKWSAWAHRTAGDSVLHLALRWRKFKALAGLYPVALAPAPCHDGVDGEAIDHVPSGFFRLDLRDAHGSTASDLAARLLGTADGLVGIWKQQKAADAANAERRAAAERAAFAAAVAAGHAALAASHARAAEEYRLGVRQVGASTEADTLLGQRRVLAPPGGISGSALDPGARLEAKRHIWVAAGLKPPPDLGPVPANPDDRPDDDIATLGRRPGGAADAFPLDLAEVGHGALRAVLERVRDGRPRVERLSTQYELKYAGALGPTGGLQLGLCLPACVHLTTLCLAHMRLGPAGALPLARGLRRSAALTYLDLRSNALTDAGALPFAAAIADGSAGGLRLRTLCLDANRLDGPGVACAALAAALAATLNRADGGLDGALGISPGKGPGPPQWGGCALRRLSLTGNAGVCGAAGAAALAELHAQARRITDARSPEEAKVEAKADVFVVFP